MAATDGHHPLNMSKALEAFLAAEDGDDDAAPEEADDDTGGDGVALGEVDISTGGGSSLAGLEQQLDRLSDHPVLRAILDQVRCPCERTVMRLDYGARHSRAAAAHPVANPPQVGSSGDSVAVHRLKTAAVGLLFHVRGSSEQEPVLAVRPQPPELWVFS